MLAGILTPPGSGDPQRKMSAEALYTQIGQLIEAMPNLTAMGPISPEVHRWLGRAHVLIGEAEGLLGETEFSHYRNTFERDRWAGAERITGLLFRALARVETEVPASLAGTFIPAGNTFDAMAAAVERGILILAWRGRAHDFIPLINVQRRP